MDFGLSNPPLNSQIMPFRKYDVAIRIQALALADEGVRIERIKEITGLSKRAIYDIKAKAKRRGHDPTISRALKLEFVEDGERSGRPVEITEAREQEVPDTVRKDRNGREKPVELIAHETTMSAMSVYRILNKHGFNKVEPTYKPGLTPAIKAARYAFALRYQHWIIEDWKKVIWSDETSVVLGQRRGGV